MIAAIVLIAVKLATGLATHSLGLVSEAIHSGTDLVAALLTYFAVRVAARPADVTHQFGHGKAEHLSALAEAALLSAASIFISFRAIERLTGANDTTVQTAWRSDIGRVNFRTSVDPRADPGPLPVPTVRE